MGRPDQRTGRPPCGWALPRRASCGCRKSARRCNLRELSRNHQRAHPPALAGWPPGEIAHFPSAHETVRTAAVAGMGRHGTFNLRAAERLYASLMAEIARLPQAARVAMVLIGSGAGNLSIANAAQAVVTGFGQTLLGLSEAPALEELVIVEIDRLRADKIHWGLQRLDLPAPPMRLSEKVEVAGQGNVSLEAAAVYGVLALARTSTEAEHEPDEHMVSGPMREVLRGVNDEIRTEAGSGFAIWPQSLRRTSTLGSGWRIPPYRGRSRFASRSSQLRKGICVGRRSPNGPPFPRGRWPRTMPCSTISSGG